MSAFTPSIVKMRHDVHRSARMLSRPSRADRDRRRRMSAEQGAACTAFTV